jgi:hypothetical protein
LARVRRPGDAAIPPPTRGPRSTALAALLGARRFRVAVGGERVADNLRAHGGELAADAAAWIGELRPPPDAPSVALGEHAGTLGPRSFGFLNNVGGVAALDAPLPALPRRGGLGLVVPARDALPDLGPLALARDLGVSWIISVGDGDPAEALAFLGADAATAALAIALGPGAHGPSLRGVLGVKPSVVLGGDAICRAVARRAGAITVDAVDEWLARAALLDAGVAAGAAVAVIVVGGGRAFVEAEVRAARLSAEVSAVDERRPEELMAAIERARAAELPVVLVAGGPPPPISVELPTLLRVDLRHPEHLRALCNALAAPPPESDSATGKTRVNKDLLEKTRAELNGELSDHDAKRLLKAYGARVTRQAPANNQTKAVELAKQIGLPVLIVDGEDARTAETLPDVKRLTTLMLQSSIPHVMVRERFPEVPRARARVVVEKGLGLVLRVGDACALLPLARGDAAALAAATPARRAADQRAVAELLARVAACAEGEGALLELELYVGAEPAVLTATGSLRRP